MAGVTSDVSLQTRFLTWFRAIPICTAAILCICVGLYAAQLVFGWDDFAAYCMQPASVLFRYQVYRAYTAIFLHGGVLHVAFNMMTFVPLGTSLERMVGSFRCCYLLVVLFATIAAVIHVLAALVAAYNPVYQVRRELYACAIGFSGIVFALIVVETHMSRATTRSIFGFFAVPAQLYPWALLVLFQVIMPHVSLLGHLSGLLVGQLYTRQWLVYLIPGPSTVASIEAMAILQALVGLPQYITNAMASDNGTGLPFSTSPTSPSSGRTCTTWLSTIGRQIGAPFRSSIAAPTASSTSSSSPGIFRGRGQRLGSTGYTGLATDTDSPGAARQDQGEPGGDNARDKAARAAAARAGQSIDDVRGPDPPMGPSTPPSNLVALEEMGYEASRAKAALAAAHDDLELALSLLSAEQRA